MSASLRASLHDLLHPSPKTVPGLDLLRSMAVLLVMSGHWGDLCGRYTVGSGAAILKLPLFHFGWTGVDLFFVLSGFLIGGQLWRELSRTGTVDLPRFLLRRGMRIWPYYFAFLAFMLAFMIDVGWRSSLQTHGWRQFLPDLFFLSNYMQGGVSGGWSLSTEEQFYVAVPLALLLVRRWPLRWQWVVPTLALCLLPVLRYLAVRHFGRSPGPDNPFVIYSPFHTHADGLAVGLLVAWAAVAVPKLMTPLTTARNLLFAVPIVAVALVLRSCSQDVFSFSALALIYGAMAVFALRDTSIFSRFAGWRPFYVISRLSYAMYLNHFLLVEGPAQGFIAAHRGGYTTFLVGYVGMIALSMAIATVTFLLIESPFLQWRERLFASDRSGSALPRESGPVPLRT